MVAAGGRDRDIGSSEFDHIRNALRFAIERKSLRAVAVQVEMSPTGLQEFVDGAKPYGKTRAKVRTWFYRETGLNNLAPEDAEAILRRLVCTLPEPDRGVRRLLDSVEAAYIDEGMDAPKRVRRVRQQVTMSPD